MPEIKVLIVDDVLENRTLLSKVIEKLGYKYDLAENGKEAIEKLEQSNFDIIFMDIKMPVMSGIEATKYIRANFPFPKNRVKIVAITAYKYKEFFDDFHDVGFNDIISKPYTIEKVSNIINYQNIISSF